MFSLLLRGRSISLLVRRSLRLFLCHWFVYIHGTNEVIGIHIHNIDRFLSPMLFALHPEELETKRCEKMGIYTKMTVYFNYVGNNCFIKFWYAFQRTNRQNFKLHEHIHKMFQGKGSKELVACLGSQMTIFVNLMLEFSRGPPPTQYLHINFFYLL